MYKSWGFFQTILEFIIFFIIFWLVVIISPQFFEFIFNIYLLWTLLRLLNFVGLTKLFGKRFESFITLKTSFEIPKTYKSAVNFSNISKSKSKNYSSNDVSPQIKKIKPKTYKSTVNFSNISKSKSKNYSSIGVSPQIKKIKPKTNYISWIARPISWIRKLLSNHFKDYFNFTGKINRNDYFRKICFHFLDVIPLILLTEFLNLPSQLIGLIIISFLSLSSRRMRDVGKSPFWLIIFSLITILAFVNDIFILIAFPFLFILVFWLIKPSLKVGNIFK